ncbi:MAG TPA: zinc ribbon domain-containing protein [Acidobacteriota bacterium]
MPIYEYLCQACNRRFSRFFWRIADANQATCACGSKNLTKLISRVAMLRSEESRLDSLADPGKWGGLDENDPKSMARMMKKLGGEMGEDTGPEFDEAVDRLEAGEDPESVDNSLETGGGSSDDFG